MECQRRFYGVCQVNKNDGWQGKTMFATRLKGPAKGPIKSTGGSLGMAVSWVRDLLLINDSKSV